MTRKHLRQIFPQKSPAEDPKTPIRAHAPTRAPDAPKATSILDSRFAYSPAVETDLAAKFKKMGFKANPKRPKFGR